MIGEIQRVSAEIKRAEGLLELDRQRHEVAKAARERLAVAAPFTGTILQLPRLHNGHVKAGETIALFEKSGERGITAFLTQDEVLDIELGGFVEVYIPATGEIARAQIVDIDRTMGFFRQASKRSPVRLQWREAKERTARVSLAFVDSHEISGDSRYRAGLPVTVNFSRKAGGYLQARVKRSAQQILSSIPGRSLFAYSAQGLWQAYRNNNRRLVERIRDYLADTPEQTAAGAQLPSRLGQIAEGFVLDPRVISKKAAANRPRGNLDPNSSSCSRFVSRVARALASQVVVVESTAVGARAFQTWLEPSRSPSRPPDAMISWVARRGSGPAR